MFTCSQEDFIATFFEENIDIVLSKKFMARGQYLRMEDYKFNIKASRYLTWKQ
jgi:hypothetical protein